MKLGQLLHDEPQVVEVARQPVHAVHHHCVVLAREGEQPFQFRTLPVLARSFVGKEPIDRDMLELAFRVLVEAAHPDVADAVTLQGVLLNPICQEELYNPGRDVSINPNYNPILTPQRPVPDVRLGYTST